MDIVLDGIDVSENNSIRDWSVVPGDLGIMRAGQGGWFMDKDYNWNVARVRATKRYVGHYMVVEPVVDTVRGQLQSAEAQANRFIQIVGGDPRRHDFAVVDWESPRKEVPPPPVEDVLAVFAAISDRGWTGRLMWYTFYSLAKPHMDKFPPGTLWLSTLGNPYATGERWCRELGAVLWQYDQFAVDGCRSSPIDVNMILDAERMDLLCGLDAEPPRETSEEEQVYFQIISDLGTAYVFGPNGAVFMGGFGTVHGALSSKGTAPVVATGIPSTELDAFVTAWRKEMNNG